MNNSSLITDARNDTATSDSTVTYVFAALNVLGLVLNSLVIAAVSRPNVIPGKTPRTYLLNQLVGEWACSFFESFTWLIDRDWPVPANGWGTLACKLVYNRALYYTVFHATYTNLVLLTVERYVAVVHPSKHDKLTPALNALVIFLSWATGAVRSTFEYLQPERSGRGCTVNPMDLRVVSLVVVCWTLYIPVTVVAGLNGRILCVLRRQSRLVRTHSSNVAATHTSVSLRAKLQRELTSSVCIVCFTSILVSSPLAIVYVLMSYDLVQRDGKGPLFQGLSHLASTFYTINPAVCIFQLPSIRKQLAATFRCHRATSATERETNGNNASTVVNTSSLGEP